MATANIKDSPDQNYARKKWFWFLLLGATMLVAGMFALICTTTTTLMTLVFLGWFFLITGGVQLIESFTVRSWSGFLMHLITALFQTIVGFMILSAPAANAVLITFILATFLMVTGLLRLIAGFRVPVVGGLIALSGLASFILGLMIWRQWPASSLWVIGLFVAIDLIIHGMSWIVFALRVRNLPQASDPGSISVAV